MLHFSTCPNCGRSGNVEWAPDEIAHRDYGAKCDGCGHRYRVEGSAPPPFEKAFRVGVVEVRWLPRVEGDAVGLMQRFTREFDYENVFGRLMLTKSACFEVLDEYVEQQRVRREPLADWLDSLPWEMDDDGDGSLDLHIVWEESGFQSLSDPATLATAQAFEVLRRNT